MPTALQEAIARTRASYDATPYVSAPHVRQQPARMAAAALWFGLTAPPAATARVLEIGCALGGHIIPLAAVWPKAQFVGVDLSPAQIEAGRARVERLGLANIALRALSLDEIGSGDGAFDFIICHGVFSWIAEPLRETLLRVVAERLAPEGVAAISFNVLPGWRLFQIARDSMFLHARLNGESSARTRRASELFDLLSEESNDGKTYGRFWRDEARRMAAEGEAYIEHEIFEEDNAPLAFSDFCSALDRHGLAYLGECNVSANSEDSIAPAGAASIRALAQGDDRAREQYIDIFSGRAFREALVVHAGRSGAVRRELPRDRLDAFHFVPPLNLTVRPPSADEPVWRVGDDDEGIAIEDEAVASAIGRLADRLPRSSRLEDIAPATATEPRVREGVADALARLTAFGHCAISSEPVMCATRLAERPVASRLAASDARVGAATTSLRHETVRLEPLQRLFLPLLDGTRTRDDLLDHALNLAERGALKIAGPDGRIEGRANLAAALAPATDRCLESLLSLALLEGD
jgi:trans-aconitate methyltransferase/methyltransferase-like protein